MMRSTILIISLGAAAAVVVGVAAWQGLVPGLPSPQPTPASVNNASARQAAPAPAPQEMPRPAPQFDTVRVEPTGEAVIAGHGEPHAKIALLADNKVLGEVQADSGGDFAMVPPALAPGTYVLTLRSTSGWAAPVPSQQTVTVSIPPKGQKGVVVALAEPGQPSRLLTDPTAPEATPAGSEQAAAAPNTDKANTDVATKDISQRPAPRPTSGEIKTEAMPNESVSQVAKIPSAKTLLAGPVPATVAPSATATVPNAAPGAALQGVPSVAIKTAEEDNGGFYAAGIAPPGTHLRIYLNGSALADVTADAQGQWSVTVGKGVVGGHYVVRADALDAQAKVQARAEVPFDVPVARAEVPSTTAKTQAALPADKAKPDAQKSAAAPSHAVVAEIATAAVTRGDSLWRISRKTLGEGVRYTLIYQANASQIRDPNLIYPGQVFVVPHSN